MKKILAVSGGVDSMVMLDIMRKVERLAIVEQWCDLEHYGCTRPRLLVVTFDHRTRESSADDAKFVVQTLQGMNMLYALGQRVRSGLIAEAEAREVRYDFLQAQAKKMRDSGNLMKVRDDYDAGSIPFCNDNVEIYTAHHLDDLVETVAINLLRGTGWRGLAVLDTPGIRRPFLEPKLLSYVAIDGTARVFTKPLDKRQILIYASENKITFRQDPTNTSEQYLRNRVRMRLSDFSAKMEIYRLWQRQKELKKEIDTIIKRVLPAKDEPWERGWFWELNEQKEGEKIALEFLRAGLLRGGIKATRPQIQQFYQAILNYRPGKYFNLPGDKMAKITKNQVFLP